MIRNGVLRGVLESHPGLEYLSLHNVDTLGATADPALLGRHIASGAAVTIEVTPQRVNGRPRLVEGLALPSDAIGSSLTFYNTGTYWITIDHLLDAFGLRREDLADEERTAAAVRQMAQRMPSYITNKDVKKRWGRGQEDIFPVAQFERLWGDMTAERRGVRLCRGVSVAWAAVEGCGAA